MKKTTFIVSVAIALVVGVALGYALTHTEAQVPTTAVGDSYSTAKIAQQSLNLATSTAASLYNGDGKDRIISSVDYYAANLGTFGSNVPANVSALSWLMSTSTDIYTAASTNYILNTTVATTSPQLYVATTTPGLTGSVFTRVWAAGTYLNLFQNATSSTASATVVVRYFAAP